MLLIDFDIAVAAETEEKESESGRKRQDGTDSSWVELGSGAEETVRSKSGTAIDLLVDHTHSIPVSSAPFFASSLD